MTSFFEKRDPWGHGLAVYVLAGLVFLLPLIGIKLRDVHFNNDVRDWLPHDDQDARALAWHDEHFQRDPSILVSWDGSSLQDPRVQRFVNRLTQASQDDAPQSPLSGVEGVTSPFDLLERMTAAGLEPDEAARRLEGVLLGPGDLKVELTDAGRTQQVMVQQSLQEFGKRELGLEIVIRPPEEPAAAAAGDDQGVEVDEEADGESSDVAAVDPAIEEPIVPEPAPHDFQLHWTGIHRRAAGVAPLREHALSLQRNGQPLVQDCFFTPGAPVALFVRLQEGDSDALKDVLPAIRDAAVAAGVEESAFHMAGSPVGQWQLDVESTRSIWNRAAPRWKLWERSPFALSAIVGMLAAFFLLRSVRLALLVLVVSFYSSTLCVVLVPILGPVIGSGPFLNIVLSVMPNLLLVLTASGAIHVANYWRAAAARDPHNAVARAVKVAWMPCVMASLTTAIGMASLITSGLVPVRDFGIYSALGTILSIGMILYGFPSILAVLGGLPKRFEDLDTDKWRRYGRWIARHHVACSSAFVLLLGVGLYGLRSFRTETKVIRYFPDDARIVQDYNAIEESLAGVVTIETVVSFGEQAQEELDLIQRLELIRALEERVKQVDGVSGAFSLADLRPEASENQNRKSILYRRKLQRLEQEIFERQVESSKSLVTHATHPLTIRRDGRAVTLPAGSEIWRVRAQCAMMTDLSYADLVSNMELAVDDVVADHAGVEHIVTGMVPLFLRTQQAVIESLITSFGLAFIVIAVMMIVLLRSVSSGLLSMIPNIWPTVMVFGLVSLAGVPIDIGTMITASVALGIAIDGTVHLLTWFREGIAEGRSRADALAHALAHCGPALWQTSVSIALAMLMLIFADLLLVSRFGWMMSAAVFAALIADIVVTPALLAGPLGALIERAVKRRAGTAEPAPGLKLAETHEPAA